MRALYAISVFLMLFACKPKPENPNDFPLDENSSNNDIVSNRRYEKQEVKKVLSVFPSPYKLALLFAKESETGAIPEWVEIKNKRDYSSFLEKMLTVGIYQADLAFAAAYGEIEKFNQYYAALNNLLLESELSFMPKYPDDSISGSMSKDSLSGFYNHLFVESDLKLKTGTNQEAAIIIVTASWIESMYLGSKIVQDKEKGYKKIIAGQKTKLQQLLLLWNSVDEKNSQELRGRLEVLDAIYEKVELLKPDFGLTTEEALDSNAFIEEKIRMSLPVLQAIEKELEGIRNFIVEK